MEDKEANCCENIYRRHCCHDASLGNKYLIKRPLAVRSFRTARIAGENSGIADTEMTNCFTR